MPMTVASIAAAPAIGIGAKAAGGAVAFLNPIIGIIIAFLPEIIKGFMKLLGGDPKAKQREAVRVKLSGEVFPSIKRKLRADLPSELETAINSTIEKVREQFDVQINNRKEAIDTQIAAKEGDINENEAARQKLEGIRSEVERTATEIMAWGK